MVRKGFAPAQIINKVGEAEIHITRDTQMVESSWGEYFIYRPGKSLGERVYRVIQR